MLHFQRLGALISLLCGLAVLTRMMFVHSDFGEKRTLMALMKHKHDSTSTLKRRLRSSSTIITRSSTTGNENATLPIGMESWLEKEKRTTNSEWSRLKTLSTSLFPFFKKQINLTDRAEVKLIEMLKFYEGVIDFRSKYAQDRANALTPDQEFRVLPETSIRIVRSDSERKRQKHYVLKERVELEKCKHCLEAAIDFTQKNLAFFLQPGVVKNNDKFLMKRFSPKRFCLKRARNFRRNNVCNEEKIEKLGKYGRFDYQFLCGFDKFLSVEEGKDWI